MGLRSQVFENIMTFNSSGCGSKMGLESLDDQNRNEMGA